MFRGSCLCGAVKYEACGEGIGLSACHCSQCRKTSGHYFAAVEFPVEKLQIENDEQLAWYQSSPIAKRGFCSTCGSSLFWKPEEGSSIWIGAGSIDGKIDLRLVGHVFVADKGDYYDICDGLGHKEQQ